MASIQQQITAVIAGAKAVPTKCAAIIEDYKEELFMKKLREALPESEFEIVCKGGLTPGTKTIFITKKKPRDPMAN